MMSDLSIVSMNVRGLADHMKRLDVFDFLKKHNASIYCLQDFHSTMQNESDYKEEWGSNNIFTCVTSKNRDTTILFTKIPNML